MMNPLDMLVIVFMVMSAASLLAVCLMFLMKNETVKKICFWFLALQGLLVSVLNALMTPMGFPGELALGWLFGGMSVAALLLQLLGKSENRSRIARILAAASVVLGMINAFII